jgi:hypothetical protein
MTVTVTHGEDKISIQPAGPPYGYSSNCPIGTSKFNAAPGTKLTVSVIKNGSEPLPPGELIIVGNWSSTKDKLVGIALDQWLGSVPIIAIMSGLVLILFAALLIWRRRA